MSQQGPIGVFDSGYGGLTILRELVDRLPDYDYLYLGDNARAPYGNRSFETVYDYTLECVRFLLGRGCKLVIVACNTSSARALRTIQQKDLPLIDPSARVLGVIRPTTEIVGNYTRSSHIGIVATAGTVKSGSYAVEVQKFFPGLSVFQQACPMWVPLVENNEGSSEGADYFIKKYLDQLFTQSPAIDTVVLACTHYPLLINKIRKYVPENVTVLSQGPIVAESLQDYLNRHPEIEERCSRNGTVQFLTTDDALTFEKHAALFFGKQVRAEHLSLG